MTAGDASAGDLLARVRERLAHTATVLTPDVMAAALRAECGGVLGDTELLDGLAYLDFVAKVADVFEALTLVTQVTRFMRVASSPDFPAEAEASADGTLR